MVLIFVFSVSLWRIDFGEEREYAVGKVSVKSLAAQTSKKLSRRASSNPGFSKVSRCAVRSKICGAVYGRYTA